MLRGANVISMMQDAAGVDNAVWSGTLFYAESKASVLYSRIHLALQVVGDVQVV